MSKIKVFSVLVIAFICGLLIAKPVFWDGCIVVSSGQRVGELQRIATRGIFIKTNEGELALYGSGGSQKGKVGQSTTDFANTWAFSIDNDELYAKIAELVRNGQTHVRIEYVEYFFSGRYDSNYRASKVEPIK